MTAPHVEHLEDLQLGDRFRFAAADLRDADVVYALIDKTIGRATIRRATGAVEVKELVKFSIRDENTGALKEAMFNRSVHGDAAVALGSEVIRVRDTGPWPVDGSGPWPVDLQDPDAVPDVTPDEL